jgi:hypothetical protein
LDIEFEEMDLPTVVVKDDAGRSLPCYIEHSLQLKEASYVVLMPVDTPVYLFAFDDEESEDPLIIEADEDIAALYPIAKAVLEEQNMVLHWSAFSLTVSGDVPDLEEEEEDYGYDPDDANGTSHEAFQLLAEFLHEDQEYAICAPLNPVLILARMVKGQPQVLEEDELERIQPLLEEFLAGQVIDMIEEDDEDDEDDFDEEE